MNMICVIVYNFISSYRVTCLSSHTSIIILNKGSHVHVLLKHLKSYNTISDLNYFCLHIYLKSLALKLSHLSVKRYAKSMLT